MKKQTEKNKKTKKLLVKLPVFLVIFIVLFMSACSEKSSKNTLIPTEEIPPQLSNTACYTFTMPALSEIQTDTTVVYKDNEVPAISLDNFIDKAITDSLASTSANKESRKLFTYELIASDGFSPRDRTEPDLNWCTLKNGFLLPENDFRSYFNLLEISTYNVKFLEEIRAYRTIIVKKVDGEEVLFQLKSNVLTITEIPNYNDEMENAIALNQFITKYITENPEIYNYLFTAVDDFTQTYSWNELQKGYWLTESERTTFPSIPEDEMGNSMRRFKSLMKITLIER